MRYDYEQYRTSLKEKSKQASKDYELQSAVNPELVNDGTELQPEQVLQELEELLKNSEALLDAL